MLEVTRQGYTQTILERGPRPRPDRWTLQELLSKEEKRSTRVRLTYRVWTFRLARPVEVEA